MGVITSGTVVYATDDAGSAGGSGNETKIIGGHESTENYSFVSSLQYERDGNPDSHRCSGSLVDSDWVILAAHCVTEKGENGDPYKVMDPKLFHLRVGSLDRTSGGSVANAKAIKVHPDYKWLEDSTGDGHDMALVQLDKNVSQKPVAMADALPKADTKVREMGWGYTKASDSDPSQLPKKLHELDSKVLDPKTPTCVSEGEDGDAWGIREGDFCVDNPGGDSGTCGGDSGGPAVAKVSDRWQLLGLNSRALGDCAVTKDIFTGIGSHSDWISSVTG